MAGLPILSIITFLPVVGALLILFTGNGEAAGHRARQIALVFTLIDFVLTLILWANFRNGTADFQILLSGSVALQATDFML